MVPLYLFSPVLGPPGFLAQSKQNKKASLSNAMQWRRGGEGGKRPENSHFTLSDWLSFPTSELHAAYVYVLFIIYE